LPKPWIERIFREMSAMYGKHFADMWAGADLESVKETWARRLAGYTPDELGRGLGALGRYCPTLAEFMQLCRPPLDYETAYREAAYNLHARERGEDEWSNPAIYWAAQAFGPWDCKNLPYERAEKRWRECLDKVVEDGCGPVPPPLLALPSVGKVSISQDEQKERLREIFERFGWEKRL